MYSSGSAFREAGTYLNGSTHILVSQVRLKEAAYFVIISRRNVAGQKVAVKLVIDQLFLTLEGRNCAEYLIQHFSHSDTAIHTRCTAKLVPSVELGRLMKIGVFNISLGSSIIALLVLLFCRFILLTSSSNFSRNIRSIFMPWSPTFVSVIVFSGSGSKFSNAETLTGPHRLRYSRFPDEAAL